eukprot:448848_1
MKEEALNSGFCILKLFNEKVILKSYQYFSTAAVKEMKAKYHPKDQAAHYGINKGAGITLKHIQSVIMYTDFTDLSTLFSSTFRPAYFGEALESIKKRNQCFYYLSKTL